MYFSNAQSSYVYDYDIDHIADWNVLDYDGALLSSQ